jgi:integrase
MTVVERILKINTYGELVQFNSGLRRWELVSIAWSWGDIHSDHIDESKENWEAYQEESNED